MEIPKCQTCNTTSNIIITRTSSLHGPVKIFTLCVECRAKREIATTERLAAERDFLQQVEYHPRFQSKPTEIEIKFKQKKKNGLFKRLLKSIGFKK